MQAQCATDIIVYNLNMLKIVFLSKIDTNVYFNKKNKEDRYTLIRYAYIKCMRSEI